MGLNSLRGGVVDKPNLKYSIHILDSIKNYVMWEVHIRSYCFELLQHFQYGLKKVRLQTRTAIIVGAETELVCGSKNILCKVT